ncbi:hypothetical protein [Streptomyces sp. R08]|uniref:SUKH-4 immunity protein of toxin-antitoxin system n=1 Tax=Streptomyces sp. R08 TaxID=3238624 RepID=A0AB39M3J3_9ACTN
MGSTPTAPTGLLLPDRHPVAVSGVPLPHRPRFTPLGGIVSVSPHADQRGHEALLSETFGSVDWLSSANDEFRFGKADEELKGITLSVPDDAFPASRAPVSWLDTPPTEGSLRSLRPENFDAPPATLRWTAPGGDLLLCAYDTPSAAPRELLRLRVARDLDLVFADGSYAGWILAHPAAHLAHPGGTPAEHEPPAELIRAMGVFFDLFVEPKIDHMQDGDPELLGEIDALLTGLAPLADDPGASVLRDRVAEFRESWFE